MALKPPMISGAIVLALAGHFGYHNVYLNAQQQRAKLQEQLTHEQETQALRAQLAGSLQDTEQFRQRLPTQPAPEWLVAEVSKFADKAGVRLGAINPDTPQQLQQFTFLRVSFDFTVTSYFELVKFLDELEHASTFFRVDQLDVSRSGQGTSQIRMTVSTFRLPSLEGLPAPEPASAAAP